MKAIFAALFSVAVMVALAWQRSAWTSPALKSSIAVRAARRAYDGAPPVIPHVPFGMACVACHTDLALQVPGVGTSPPMPHTETPGMGRDSNCRQCHVFRVTEAVFVPSTFVSVLREPRSGGRQYPGAPPTLPHPLFMREACAACHTGPAAREEIRCLHPDRLRCLQCHALSVQSGDFVR